MFPDRCKFGYGRPRLIVRTGSDAECQTKSAVACFNFSLATRAAVVSVRPSVWYGEGKNNYKIYEVGIERQAAGCTRVSVDLPKRADRLWGPQSLQFNGYRW